MSNTIGYKRLSEVDVEKLKWMIGKDVNLSIYFIPHLAESHVSRSKSPPRDDWEQYGGYPGQVPGGYEFVDLRLVEVLGFEDEGSFFPTSIVGIEKKDNIPELTHMNIKTGVISYIQSIGHGDMRVYVGNEHIISIKKDEPRRIIRIAPSVD